MMEAYVCRRYGGPEVVERARVPKPVPKDDEVLVRVHATTVSSADWRTRSMTVPTGLGLVARLAMGISRPRQPILGTELAGTVEAVGRDVTRFRAGEAVMGFPGAKMGAHAEYAVLAEDGPIAVKPAALSFEEAASLPFGATTALHFLRRAGVGEATRVLVIGASGAVGTAMVQLAKRHFGASVTGVTGSANVELVASLGADRVIDYTREDFTRAGESWDVIADTVGTTRFARCRPVLSAGGKLLAVAGGLPEMLTALNGRVIAGPADERPEDIERIAGFAEAGVLRPVVDRRYRFDQMVEAHAYVETGRKRGSVVVTLA